MADKARQWTDKKLSKMESHISSIYKTAVKDVSKKWNAFMERAGEKADKLQKKYESAVQSGDKDLIKSTKDELIQYKKYITFQSEIYSNMIKETAGQLAHVNETALAYVNDQMPSIYMNNFNEVKGDADNLGVQFSIVNEATVKRLIADKDLSLLRKRLDIPKDERWNTKQLNSSVLQGILQGESMPDIAKRIFNITNRNEASAIRNARTMVTCAENRGRLDSYKELEDNGLVLKKVWMATPDGRTRDWHVDLDGQEVDLKDSFVDGLGNELEYPGDPGGAPETVYNCRCTMITHITGIKMENGKIKALDYLPTSELHEQQMEAEVERRKEEKEKEKQKQLPAFTVAQGKDISATWERRSDQFDFEIEDAINAQGFDGLPRVVSREEFDKAVKQANDGNGFVAQRTYSAPDQETLDAYRQQLYEGKWYVDCSTGGAQYGQGMYCAADYTGTITKGITDEMKHYQMLGSERMGEIPKESLESIIHDQKNRANDVLQQYKSGQISKEAGLAEYRRINSMNPSEYVATYMKNSDIGGARSYVETMTLDPSAKIISYDDIAKMQSREGVRSKIVAETIKEAGLTNEELAFVLTDYKRDMLGSGIFTYEESQNLSMLADKMELLPTEEWWDKYDAAIAKLDMSKVDDKVMKGEELKTLDLGAYASIKGYDAINAGGHGESGSYTVILNRTKVIILGEE